jgi:hypothetical protein
MPGRLASPDFRLFLGKSGSGKSFLARHQVGSAARVLICDPNGEPAWAEGAAVVHDRGELVQAMRGPRWRIAWRGMIGGRGAEGVTEEWEWANRCALAAGDCLVVWDEVDMCVPTGRLPQHGYRIVNAGRHVGVRCFACARRPYRLPRDLSANAGRIVAFRMTEPRDLRYLAEVMGEGAAGQLPGLGEYQAMDWREGGAKVKKSPFR